MFQFIRRHQAIGLIFIGIVIVSFVIFFSPNQKMDRNGIVAGSFGTIGGRAISRAEYLEARAEARLARMLREGGVWPTDGRGFDEAKEVMNRLFLIEEARRLGVVVTDEVAAARILDLPFLHDEKSGGGFSRTAYDQFLAMIQKDGGMSRSDFEQFMRHDVAIEHLVNVFGLSGSLVPPREAEARYRAGNEQYAAQLVVISASNYLAQVDLNPTNISGFYSNHLADYRIPERAVVRYVKFASTNFFAEADQQITANTNLNSLIDAEYARQGADAFRDAQGKPMTAEAAKADLKDQYRKRLGLEAARKKANDFANRLYQLDANQDSLTKLAGENGLTVQTSLPFDQNRPPFDMQVPATFARAAFQLSAEEPFATPIVGEDGAYVYAFDKKLPSEIMPLDRVKDRLQDTYRRTESRDLAQKAGRDFATKASLALEQGKTFEAVAAEAGFKTITLTNFSRTTTGLTELGPRLTVSELLRAAEDVPAGKVAPFAPAADGGFVMFVQARNPVPAEQIAKDLPAFLTQLRQFGKFSSFNEWEKKRFAAADVKGPGTGGVSSRTNAPAPSASN